MKPSLLARAKALRENGPDHLQTGLCTNLRLRGVEHRVFEEIAKGGPQYSGNIEFPVPLKHNDPAVAYQDARDYGWMWDKATPYGQARWDLLDFLIAELSESVSPSWRPNGQDV